MALLASLVMACGTNAPATPFESPPAASSTPSPVQPSAGVTETPNPVATSVTTPVPPSADPGVAAPALPDPPPAAQLPAGSVDEQAAALAQAAAGGGQAALAPLLRAYDAAGMAVTDSNDVRLAGDAEDPVGLPYWLIWLSAGSNPDVRLSLADAMKVFVATPDAADLDTQSLADAALTDLREMASDDDAQRRFFGQFLAALARAGGPDPLDPQTTADEVMLNSIAVTFLVAGALRGVVTEVARANPQGLMRESRPMAWARGVISDSPVSQAPAASSPCNFSGIPEQIVYWAGAIASRVAGGLQLPGMQQAMPSVVQLVLRNPTLAARITTAAGWGGGLVSALGLLIQMTHIDVDVVIDPDPLVRTHSAAQDGHEAKLTAAVLFDLDGSSMDGGQGIGNCLLLLLLGLGIQTSLPSNGRIPGASVQFEGAMGFGQGLGGGGFVQFPNASQLTQDTNQNGEATIDIQGIHQRKEKAQYSPELMREASVHIRSTAGQTNERTIASAFINGLLAIPSGGQTAIGALADVLSTVKWDVGERVFRVKDWLDGWYIDQPFTNGLGSGHIVGQKCDGPAGQWQPEGVYDQADAMGSQVWNIDIAMQTDTSGRGLFDYSDVQEMTPVPGVTVITTGNARGEVTLTIDSATGVATMNMRETFHVFRATTTSGGHGGDQKAPLQSYTMTWQPGGDCDPPP